MSKHCRYRVGIDVGLYSVGLAAIEIDDSSEDPLEALPMRVLSLMSVIHDGALDPQLGQQQAKSRKLVSGVARRTRRLYERRRQRYERINDLLKEFGYPCDQAIMMVSGMEETDPYLPWRARIALVEGYIEDEHQRKLSLAIAIRHIARHRGWRNPYANITSIIEQAPTASSFYMEFFKKVQLWRYVQGLPLYPGVRVVEAKDALELEGLPHWDALGDGSDRPTIAELIEPFLSPQPENRFRRQPREDAEVTTIQIGKLHQSDNCYELLKIFEMQKVPEEEQRAFINAVFHQVSPKAVGAAAKLAGKDDLPGQGSRQRASRASLAFQEYRILSTIANLRIKDGKEERQLDDSERKQLYEFLMSEQASKLGPDLTWVDVAEEIGVERSDLRGVGGETEDGLPISAKRPPYLETEHVIRNSVIYRNSNFRQLRDWWENEASALEKEFLVAFFDNAGVSEPSFDDEEMQAKHQVDALLADLAALDENSLAELDKIRLASGRAAYSLNSLRRLNRRMLEGGLDVHEARKAEFGVGDDWRPEPEKLGTPTGNPAVDRTIKIVSRWLKACEKRWGKPETVAIEHVRDGFKSERQKRDDTRAMNRRYRANEKVREEIVAALSEGNGSSARGTEGIYKSEVRKWQAIQRQNGQCLYCGKPIDFNTAQMDHIVPRKGPGSSNELSNLVATCADCNRSKNRELLWSWADPDKRRETIDRVKQWNRDSYFTSERQFRNFKNDVIARLMQREADEPLDSRSIESVAWMARELRDQVIGEFYRGDETIPAGSEAVPQEPAGAGKSIQRAMVYKGWLTSEARRVSGIEGKLPWFGDYKAKTRLDRRHHAVDAAVITFMRPGVAKTLIERDALRREQQDLGCDTRDESYGSFKDWEGQGGRDTKLFLHWRDEQMQCLQNLVKKSMEEDRVVVTEPLRLGIRLGRAHKDTINPLLKKRVGDALSVNAIDKAESPALWVALTRQPDYDPISGLPENPDRRIRIHDRWLDADDTIGFMAESEDELNRTISAVRASVRNGYAEIGDTIHHARFYRIPKVNKKGTRTGWIYGMVRVFQVDLIKHQQEDVFSVVLPPQSISVRSALPVVRKALVEGTAEYLGWAVVGDEVVVDRESKLFSGAGKDKTSLFMRAFPKCPCFVIAGFGMNSKLTLRPRYLASEGIPSEIKGAKKRAEDPAAYKKAVSKMLGSANWTEAEVNAVNLVIEKGCVLSVDKVLATHPTIIRRNTLGMERWKSNNHMPVSWQVP